MSESNGKQAWIMWLVGIIATILTTAVLTMAQAVVNNDQQSRSRDDKISECVQKAVIEQKDMNKDILVALMQIQTDLKYIKSEKCR